MSDTPNDLTVTICPPATRKTALLERAYQLAAEGKIPNEIRAALVAEGYQRCTVLSHFSSSVLCAELGRLAMEGRKKKAGR